MVAINEGTLGIFSGCLDDHYSALTSLYDEIKNYYETTTFLDIPFDFNGVVLSNRPLPQSFSGIAIYYLDNEDIEYFTGMDKNVGKKYFFTPSHYCSRLLYSTCRIESIVCPPNFDKEIVPSNKIAVDLFHPAIPELQADDLEIIISPRSLKDFEGCKLFLPWTDNPFDVRLWWASQQGCLFGGLKNKNTPEEFANHYIEYQGGSWTKYCRKCFSDSIELLKKIKKNIKKFNGCAMDEKIKKALQQKPIRSEVVRSFTEIQEYAKKNAMPKKIVRQSISRNPTGYSFKKAPHLLKEKKYLFWTGGIGDVIALDGFISPADREEVLTFFYATQKQNAIKELFECNSSYPNLKSHQVVWDDFKNRWCFYGKNEVLDIVSEGNKTPQFIASEDWSIGNKFHEIRKGFHHFYGSSLLLPNNKLCELNIELPVNFYVICPFSTDKSTRQRDFTPEDWSHLLKFLEKTFNYGVVLYRGSDVVPKHPQLIDLCNKTTMLESVEILKKSIGYIGVDTCFSVLAAQLFDAKEMCIKSVNTHLYSNINIYYTPHTSFPFVHKDVGKGITAMSS